MALEYAAGRNLASNDPTTGLPGVISSIGETQADVSGHMVIVRGPISIFSGRVPHQGADSTTCGWVPSGMLVKTATLSDADGDGTLTIHCVTPGDDSQATPAAPTLITYQVEMVECQMDLITHPAVTANDAALNECIKWLATDEAERFDGSNFYWKDQSGVLQPVNLQAALNFCAAWVHGIHTYNRYYPVINKESTYTRIPGLTMGSLTNKFSITGGTAAFSADVGKFNAPDISLTGYASTGYFKSGDSYRTSGNKTWTRTEQWTWTPDGSTSAYAWIYAASSGQNGGSVS